MISGAMAFAVALLLDAGSFSSLAWRGAAAAGIAEPLLLHAAASLVFALAVGRLHARRHRQQAGRFALFAGVANAFLPMVAPIGWVLAVRPAIRPPAATTPRVRNEVRHRERGSPVASAAWHGGLRDPWGILRHAPDPRLRVEALRSTLALDHAAAIGMLRFALRDPDDEVRLLAFALVTQRELALAQLIRDCQQAIAASSTGARSQAHKSAAHAYRQLALLAGRGSPGAVPLCRRALHHAHAALASSAHDGGLHLLAARLHLELGELAPAAACIAAAQLHGGDTPQCEHLRAEVAFRRARVPATAVAA